MVWSDSDLMGSIEVHPQVHNQNISYLFSATKIDESGVGMRLASSDRLSDLPAKY